MQRGACDRRWLTGGAGMALGVILLTGWLAAGPLFAEEIGEPAFLGVQLNEEMDRPEGGAHVTRVVDGSPATEAGLREDDIIVGFEGEVIRGPLALTQRIHTRRPGDTVTLTLIRDGVERQLEVELGRRSDTRRPVLEVPSPVWVVPDVEPLAPLPPLEPDEFPDVDPEDVLKRLELKDLDEYKSFLRPLTWGQKPRLGVQLVETTPELREHLGGDEDAGVLVSKILSGLPAQKAGLQVGDLIVSVDGEPVATSSDLILVLQDKVGRTFDVEIVRDHRRQTIEVTIPEPESDRPTGPRA